jgi:hypothetical protein
MNKFDTLSTALSNAGYEIIRYDEEEYPISARPGLVFDEKQRFTGTVNLRIRPVTEKDKQPR